MRLFYLAYAEKQISETVSRNLDFAAVAKRFPLPWSHYINYAKEHWMHEGENPPVGLILCASRDTSVAHYALEGLSNRVLAAEYMTTLPKENTIAETLNKATRERTFKHGIWNQ